MKAFVSNLSLSDSEETEQAQCPFFAIGMIAE